MNSSLGDLDVTGKYYGYNNTNHSNEYAQETTSFDLGRIILLVISLITCCIGLLGNGYIIWLLGFQIKRNPFTTFVLNLAIPDFGYLMFLLIQWAFHFIKNIILKFICAFFYNTMYSNSHFLLTAISIDRCTSVLFPIWHRCARPKRLSSTACVLLWISSSLLSGVLYIMILTKHFDSYTLFSLHFLVTAVVCFPLITLSTVILFIKVCLKVKHKKEAQLLLMILITLLCFLLLAFPLNVFLVIFYVFSINIDSEVPYLGSSTVLCSCLNSSINPVISFLVGRKNQAQSKQSLKVIFQKVFKEGEAIEGR